MSKRVIEAEVVEEHIVACPHCGRRNRLYKRTAAGVYKCGTCRAALANPFTVRKGPLSMRTFGIAAASIIALLVLLVIIGNNSSSPSPSRNKVSVPTSAPVAPIAVAQPRVLPNLAPLPSISVPQFTPNANYPVRPSATTPPEIPTEVPRSGILYDAYPGSTTLGEFTVINGSSRHAIAKVIDTASDRKILSFAIHAGKRTKITAIPDGTYNVIFAFGDRVYLGTDRFEKPRGFSKFDRSFTFTTTATTTTTDTEEATYYRATTLEVTLTPVIGGNITTSSISQQEFERY